jgi:hypothetical protein
VPVCVPDFVCVPLTEVVGVTLDVTAAVRLPEAVLEAVLVTV